MVCGRCRREGRGGVKTPALAVGVGVGLVKGSEAILIRGHQVESDRLP